MVEYVSVLYSEIKVGCHEFLLFLIVFGVELLAPVLTLEYVLEEVVQKVTHAGIDEAVYFDWVLGKLYLDNFVFVLSVPKSAFSHWQQIDPPE